MLSRRKIQNLDKISAKIIQALKYKKVLWLLSSYIKKKIREVRMRLIKRKFGQNENQRIYDCKKRWTRQGTESTGTI